MYTQFYHMFPCMKWEMNWKLIEMVIKCYKSSEPTEKKSGV